MIWYIERIPAAGGASETRTLDAWGIDSATITAACWGLGGADLAIPSATAGTTAPAWADGDHLVVWAGNPASGGTRRHHLWVLMPGTHADPQAEAHQYRLVDPWYWLEQTQFFYPLTISDITTDPETGAATGCTWHMRHGTEVVWTTWAAQSSGTILGQIHRALYCAIDNGAPIAIGAIDMPGLAPVTEEQTLTCADVIARAARFSPRASQWWDMSGATPIFRAAARASRPALSLDLGPDSQTWDIAPRHDLRIDVVRVGYQWDNLGATAAWYDTAGDDTLRDGPHTFRSLVDCDSSAIASNAASHYGIAAQLYAALHSTPYTGTLAWWGAATDALTVHPGHALDLTGSLAAYESMAAPISSVALTITSANEDSVTVNLGLPPTLGANDLFELYNLGRNLASGGVSTGGGTTEPDDPTDEDLPGGTLMDLLGGLAGLASGTGGVQWRHESLACEMIHYQEYAFGDATTPPTYYRRVTAAGSVRTDYTSFPPNCATPSGLYRERSYAGTIQYSAATGARSGTVTESIRAVDGTVTSSDYGASTSYRPYADGYAATSHTHVAAPSHPCYSPESGGDGAIDTGTGGWDLADPDTEPDARTRAESAATWSEWSGTAVAAAYEQRTGAAFAMVLEQFRGSWTGYQPNWYYLLPIDTEVQPYGDTEAAWTAGESITLTLQADSTGAITLEATELSCPVGYRRRPSTVHALVPLTT